MSRQVPWPRVLAEGIVIIASILLAFGIDAAWEEFNAKRHTREVMARVHAELLADRDQVLGAGGVIRAAMAALDVAVLLDEADTPQTAIAVPDTLLAAILNVGTYEFQTPELEGLIDSGGLSSIKDVEVLAAIATWERWVRNAEEQQLRASAFAADQLLPVLARRADVSHILRAMPPRLMRDGEDAQDLSPPPVLDPMGVTWLVADSELKTMISQRANGLMVARSSLLLVVESIDSLLAAIEAARG